MIKMYKECYEEAKKYNFNINMLGEVASKYNISEDRAMEYAKNYYMCILGNSIDNWKNLVDATLSETGVLKLNNFIGDNEQLILLHRELGGRTYDEFMTKLQKYCYEYCVNAWFDKDIVRNRAQELKIQYKTFKKYAKTYALEVLKLDSFELIDSGCTEMCESKQKAALTKWREFSSKREQCYREIGGGTNQEFRMKLLKFSYDYAKKVNFDRDKIRRFGKIYDLSYTTVLGYIRTYAMKYLGMTASQYNALILEKDENNLDKRIVSWVGESAARKKVYESIGANTYNEFRYGLYKMSYEYGESVDFEASKLREYAKKIGVSYEILSAYIKKYGTEVLHLSNSEWQRKRKKVEYDKMLEEWLSSSSKRRLLYDIVGGEDYIEMQENFGKYLDQELQKSDYQYKEALILMDKYDISYDMLIKLLNKYGERYTDNLVRIKKGIEKIGLEKRQQIYKRKDGKISVLLKEIEKAQDEETIKRLLDDENAKSLYNYVTNYVVVHCGDKSSKEREKIARDLKMKILRYLRNGREVLQKEKDEIDVKYIEEACSILSEFIDNEGFSRVAEFCYINNIEIDTFNEMVAIVKKYNQELYLEYLNKINRLRNKEYAILLEKINLILIGLKYGVMEDDEKRSFDLLDYYNITRLSFDDMLRIARDGMNNIEDIRVLGQFVGKYKNIKNITVDEILKMKIIVKERIISEEEKMEVINYLSNRNLPLNSCLFSLVLKRFMNGKYTVVNGKKLILYGKETYKRK